MIPSAYVRLDAMPLTPNGKIDRAALPEPVRGAAQANVQLTDMERRIAVLWGEQLDITDIGPDDDFYSLGGHSLLGMRIVARLRADVGGEFTTQLLMTTPRLRDFAAAVEAATSNVKRAAAIAPAEDDMSLDDLDDLPSLDDY